MDRNNLLLQRIQLLETVNLYFKKEIPTHMDHKVEGLTNLNLNPKRNH